jgi:hypothetical protein
MPARRHAWRRSKGRFVLGCLAGLVGCGGTDLTGRVLINTGGTEVSPVLGVEVRLVRGNLEGLVEQARTDQQQSLEGEATKILLKRTQEERGLKTAALVPLLAATAKRGPGGADCARAGAALAEIERQYAALFAQQRADLAALGVTATEPTAVLEELEAAVSTALAARTRELIADYVRNHVTMTSRVDLALYSEGDRLCASLANRGPLRLVSLDLYITYEGTRLPARVAEAFWRSATGSFRLSFESRNERGEVVNGLDRGATFETCFYAVRAAARPDTDPAWAQYGLTRLSSSRSGRWQVGWENLVLTDADRVRSTLPGGTEPFWYFPVRPPEEIFTADLGRVRAEHPAQVLRDRLTSSAAAAQLSAAREYARGCREAAQLQTDIEALDKLMDALRGRSLDDRARQHLAPVLAELATGAEGDAKRLAGIDEALASQSVGSRKTDATGAFAFEGLAEGAYTLIGTYAPGADTKMLWVVPLTVDGSLHQDLSNDCQAVAALPADMTVIQYLTGPTVLPCASHESGTLQDFLRQRLGRRKPGSAPTPSPGAGAGDLGVIERRLNVGWRTTTVPRA